MKPNHFGDSVEDASEYVRKSMYTSLVKPKVKGDESLIHYNSEDMVKNGGTAMEPNVEVDNIPYIQEKNDDASLGNETTTKCDNNDDYNTSSVSIDISTGYGFLSFCCCYGAHL